MYKIGDLFAGVGGIALGFENAGMDVLWANEIDAKACITYRANFSHHMYEGDIKQLLQDDTDVPEVDILCGGFPCQAFSVAGYRKGFKDQRGNLFFDIVELAEKVKPRVLFLENVKNLKSHDKGKTYQVIKETLESLDYFVTERVLNTCEYSEVPQNRERIFILAFKDKEAFDAFRFPKAIEKTLPTKALLEDRVEDKYYYNNSKYYSQLKAEMTNKDAIYQWRRVYVRENKSGVCPTLTANMGMGGHNVPLIIDKKDIRKLTPRECFRFQGFPDNYILPNGLADSALYKQAGNSVSVPIIQALAVEVKKALQAMDKENVRQEAA